MNYPNVLIRKNMKSLHPKFYSIMAKRKIKQNQILIDSYFVCVHIARIDYVLKSGGRKKGND